MRVVNYKEVNRGIQWKCIRIVVYNYPVHACTPEGWSNRFVCRSICQFVCLFVCLSVPTQDFERNRLAFVESEIEKYWIRLTSRTRAYLWDLRKADFVHFVGFVKNWRPFDDNDYYHSTSTSNR